MRSTTVRSWQQMQGPRMWEKVAETINALKVTLTGVAISTGSGLWGWLGENQHELAGLGVVIGTIVGLAGLRIQVNANRRRERREIAAHEARMAKLREGAR